MTAKRRQYLYRVALVLVPIISAYGLLDTNKTPLWIALIGALLAIPAPALALKNITPDSKDTNDA